MFDYDLRQQADSSWMNASLLSVELSQWSRFDHPNAECIVAMPRRKYQDGISLCSKHLTTFMLCVTHVFSKQKLAKLASVGLMLLLLHLAGFDLKCAGGVQPIPELRFFPVTGVQWNSARCRNKHWHFVCGTFSVKLWLMWYCLSCGIVRMTGSSALVLCTTFSHCWRPTVLWQ